MMVAVAVAGEHAQVSKAPVPSKAYPFADTKLAKYLTHQIDALAHEKSQRDIAAEIGYEKPNMVSMFKRGEAKVPLDKIPALAKALRVDPTHLFRLALDQYWASPNGTRSPVSEDTMKLFGNVVSDNELAIINRLRQLTKDTNPTLTKDLDRRLKEAFKK